MLKYINSKLINNILYVLLIIILTHLSNFYYNLYSIYVRGYEERMIRTYGYCGGISYGFIKKIKSQFLQFEKKVVIINNDIFPASLGLFPDLLVDKEKENLILLNFTHLTQKKLMQYSINIDDYKLLIIVIL